MLECEYYTVFFGKRGRAECWYDTHYRWYHEPYSGCPFCPYQVRGHCVAHGVAKMGIDGA